MSRWKFLLRLGRAFALLVVFVFAGALAVAAADALARGSERAGGALGTLIGRVTGGRAPVDLSRQVDPPLLERPATDVLRASGWELRGRLPPGVAGADGFYLRVYVNGQLARERNVPESTSFAIAGVPVPEGRSRIAASIEGPGVKSGMSEEIEILFDGTPPPLTVEVPKQGEPVTGERVVVRGKAESGARITVDNATTGVSAVTVAAEDASFAVEVALDPGPNSLKIRAGDAAGNTMEKRVDVVHRQSDLVARLTLSRSVFARSELPAPVSITVSVSDRRGSAVNGGAVTFSLSPPGLPTSTFETTTRNGRAVWAHVTIPKEGALPGEGLVTVRVVLPDGESVQQIAHLTIE